MTYSNNLAIHIVLSTLPNTRYAEFVKDIEESFYRKYSDGSRSHYGTRDDELGKCDGVDVVYHPLKYFIFGNYDIAFISLIDRYKFAQKLFAPIGNDVLNPATFQVITGITCYPGNDDLKKLIAGSHKDGSPKRFVGIINLKVNYGMIIGNGHFFLDGVIELIQQVIKSKYSDIEYAIFQSFSWFELTLIIFYDNPPVLADVINELRSLTVGKIANAETIITSSLYYQELTVNKTLDAFPEKDKIQRIKDTHVFSDSQTYMGMNWDLLVSEIEPKDHPFKDLELSTEIEWMISPGHNQNLIRLLSSNTDLKNIFDVSKSRFVLGKSDYLIPETSDSILNNFRLFQFVYKNNEFHPYVKKIKTRVLFDVEGSESLVKESKNSDYTSEGIRQPALLRYNFNQLALTNEEINAIDVKLKELKISRLVRIKVRKVLFNYNSGILDPVLCTFFLDFVIFIKYLRLRIEKEHEKLEVFSDPSKLDSISRVSFDVFEKDLVPVIEGFEESFSVRILNSYQFEDINDFDLDFNASVQQLLSSYNMLALEVANIYYPKYSQGLLVLLNFKNIIANFYFINYNCFHLTTPEFAFFTITKEVLNYYYLNFASPELQAIHTDVKDKIYAYLADKDVFLKDLIDSKKLDLDYLFLDAIRLCTTCNLDFDLFAHWFWSYNCQNSSLFNKYGNMEDKHFLTELCRLILLSKLYNIPSNKLSCPIPELESLWDRYYYYLEKKLDQCFSEKEFLSYITTFYTNVYGLISRALDSTGIGNQHSKWLLNFGGSPRPEVDKDISNMFDHLGKILHPHSGMQGTMIRLYNFQNSLDIFYNRFSQDVRDGKPIYYSEPKFQNSSMYISALIFTYLKVIFEENNKTVYFLKRNRATGDPIVDTDKQLNQTPGNSAMYFVDPTGGTFFIDQRKQYIYFKMRNGILQSLIHFANYQKRNFIRETVENPQS